MALEFTWVDAGMIILMFTVYGLISGKKEHDKKMAKKKEEENNDE